MSLLVSIETEPMHDPRGASLRPVTPLANRLAGLGGKNILLFNNTQLTNELPTFGPIFSWLSESLQGEFGAICSYETRNLLVGPKEGISQFAEQLSHQDIDGVVIALCKGGITSASSLFAAELELRGIPCVQLCTQMGYPLAGVTAARYVPGLPIVLVSPATGDEESFGKSETAAIAPQIAAGLTKAPAALIDEFRSRFSSESLDIARNGKMQLPPASTEATQAAGNITIRVEPGQFALQLYEQLCAASMCDGLPVIPPTESRVEAMLEFTDRGPDEVLLKEMPPSGAAITVRSVAANAVMAGCRPEYFPIVLAATECISDPSYRIFQGAITSHPGGNAVIVSGPLADQLGIHSGSGCLGPGFRANATIGRALNLTILNVARAIPGKTDLAVHGSPAKFTYCFAESAANPWQPLHRDLYSADTTSVTVHKCEGPHNVLDPREGPEPLLRAVAATAATPGGNSLVHLGQLLVILNPGQARKIAAAGWSKRDVREFLFETARHPVELARRQGPRASFPPYFLKLDQVPVMRSADDVIIVVCGGSGGHAMVGIPWGRARAVSRPILRRDGTPVQGVERWIN